MVVVRLDLALPPAPPHPRDRERPLLRAVQRRDGRVSAQVQPQADMGKANERPGRSGTEPARQAAVSISRHHLHGRPHHVRPPAAILGRDGIAREQGRSSQGLEEREREREREREIGRPFHPISDPVLACPGRRAPPFDCERQRCVPCARSGVVARCVGADAAGALRHVGDRNGAVESV